MDKFPQTSSLLHEHSPINCQRVTIDPFADLPCVYAAFAGTDWMNMKQDWLPCTQDELQAGRVKIGWRDGSFLVFSEFIDFDIYNAARFPNENTWELGDVFEIYLRNSIQQEYLELHITPENRHLRLRIPIKDDLLDPTYRHSVMDEFKITREIFYSRVWIDETESRWNILVEIPFEELGLSREPIGPCCFASFGRFDFTRGTSEAVISSTSPHKVANFHRWREWSLVNIEA